MTARCRQCGARLHNVEQTMEDATRYECTECFERCLIRGIGEHRVCYYCHTYKPLAAFPARGGSCCQACKNRRDAERAAVNKRIAEARSR